MTTLKELLTATLPAEYINYATMIQIDAGNKGSMTSFTNNGLLPAMHEILPTDDTYGRQMINQDEFIPRIRSAVQRSENQDTVAIEYFSSGNMATITAARLGPDDQDLFFEITGSKKSLSVIYEKWNADPSQVGPVPFDNPSLHELAFKVDHPALRRKQDALLSGLAGGDSKEDHLDYLRNPDNMDTYILARRELDLPLTSEPSTQVEFYRG
jgi:hypothetical protein